MSTTSPAYAAIAGCVALVACAPGPATRPPKAPVAAVRVESASRAPVVPAARPISKGPAGVPLATPWVAEDKRRALHNLDIPLTDHRGRPHTLGALVDRPALLTFFYTRCQNAGKCSAAVSRLAGLQRRLTRAGLDRDVRLIAITFEPQFDTCERLQRFAHGRGLVLGEHALAARLDSARHPQLVAELKTPVSYSAGWVNTHGVEAVLLDAAGRPVRKYITLVWDNNVVFADLKRLVRTGLDGGHDAGR